MSHAISHAVDTALNAVVTGEALTPIFIGLLQKSKERDYQPPLTFALIGRDGASAVLRYVPPDDEGLLPEQLEQQIRNVSWALPLNILITDSLGKGALITLKTDQFVKSKH